MLSVPLVLILRWKAVSLYAAKGVRTFLFANQSNRFVYPSKKLKQKDTDFKKKLKIVPKKSVK